MQLDFSGGQLIHMMAKSRARDSLEPNCEKKRPRSIQQKKTAFRNTSAWQKYRKFRKRHDKVDYITHKSLGTKWSLHHMNLDPEQYTDLSEMDNFVALNNSTHDIVHLLYPVYLEDPEVIDRLEEVLYRMWRINVERKEADEEDDSLFDKIQEYNET